MIYTHFEKLLSPCSQKCCITQKMPEPIHGIPLKKPNNAIVLREINELVGLLQFQLTTIKPPCICLLHLPPNHTFTMCPYSFDHYQRPFYRNIACTEIVFRVYIFSWSIHFLFLWNDSRLFLFTSWGQNTLSCFKVVFIFYFFALCEYFFEWPQWSHKSILTLNF